MEKERKYERATARGAKRKETLPERALKKNATASWGAIVVKRKGL